LILIIIRIKKAKKEAVLTKSKLQKIYQ